MEFRIVIFAEGLQEGKRNTLMRDWDWTGKTPRARYGEDNVDRSSGSRNGQSRVREEQDQVSGGCWTTESIKETEWSRRDWGECRDDSEWKTEWTGAQSMRSYGNSSGSRKSSAISVVQENPCGSGTSRAITGCKYRYEPSQKYGSRKGTAAKGETKR